MIEEKPGRDWTDLRGRLVELAINANIKIKYRSLSAQGYCLRFYDGTQVILVKEDDSIEEQAKTIAHEMGHLAHGHKWDISGPQPEQNEKEANIYGHDLLLILENVPGFVPTELLRAAHG